MRRPFIDNARAFGMLLVVLGHSWPESTPVTVIYAFHMPLFFFISGALWKSSAVQEGWGSFLRKQFRSLLVPYLCFGLMALVLTAALTARSLRDEPALSGSFAWRGVGSLVYGAGPGLRDVNGTLWFFTALFVTNVYFFLLCRVRSQLAMTGLSVVVATAAIFVRRQNTEVLPWNLDVAGVALVFFTAGYCLLGRRQEQAWNHRPRMIAAAAGLLFGLCAVTALNNTVRVDLRSLVIGSPPHFFIGALTGILATVLTAMVVPATRAAEYISKASIVIFPMHLFVLTTLRILEKRMVGGSDIAADLWLRGSVLALLALLGCLPIYAFFKRYLPWCIGGR